jgi:hypothetical protein
MIQGKCRTVFLLAFAMALPGLVAAQGVYWESIHTGGPMEASKTPSKTYMAPGRFKHVDPAGSNLMIVNMSNRTVSMVNMEKKTYAVMTFEEMEATMKQAGAKMDKAMAEMEEQMKDMPPEQRAAVEKMMGGMMKGKKSSPTKVNATGESKTISGVRCTKFVATQDGKPIMTAWTASGIAEFEAMRKDWEQFSRRFMSMESRFGGDIADAFLKIKGFPMQTEISGMTMTVTKVERRAIPASEFEVPGGLKKVDKKEFMGGFATEE